jgi:NAD(P)-dependent dehydrogenase (short-subunit alcohol dehydrogenase family)
MTSARQLCKLSGMNKQIVLITGVSRAEGIGFEVARQLGARGMTVVLTARKPGAADNLADRLRNDGIDTRALSLDVTAPDSIATAAAQIDAEFGRLDVLINNAAGVGNYGETASNADLGTAQGVIDATLFGAWRTMQVFLPLLSKSGSARIVNVSSGAGSHGDPYFGLESGNSMGASYGIAKAALNALTALQANELKARRILVNAVCPGFTATFPGGEAMSARPVSEGAAGIVWAAMLPADGPTGGFFRDGKPLPW